MLMFIPVLNSPAGLSLAAHVSATGSKIVGKATWRLTTARTSTALHTLRLAARKVFDRLLVELQLADFDAALLVGLVLRRLLLPNHPKRSFHLNASTKAQASAQSAHDA
jgi:hypothetical protein